MENVLCVEKLKLRQMKSSKDETVNQEIEENEVNTGDKTLIMAWIFALISGIAGIISYRKKSKV